MSVLFLTILCVVLIMWILSMIWESSVYISIYTVIICLLLLFGLFNECKNNEFHATYKIVQESSEKISILIQENSNESPPFILTFTTIEMLNKIKNGNGTLSYIDTYNYFNMHFQRKFLFEEYS